MTQRLYYSDVYLKEFDAVVLKCTQAGTDWEVIPDRSAFYPEGGGQSGDRGLIRDEETGDVIRVQDTREDGEDVILVEVNNAECTD